MRSCLLIEVSSKVVQHVLYMEARLLLDLVHKDSLGCCHLRLPFLEILTVFGVQKLGVATFDLLIVLEESLVVDQVFECFPDFFKVDVLIMLHLLVNLLLLSQGTLVVHLEGEDLVFA